MEVVDDSSELKGVKWVGVKDVVTRSDECTQLGFFYTRNPIKLIFANTAASGFQINTTKDA